MKPDRVLSMLGIAAKAGSAVYFPVSILSAFTLLACALLSVGLTTVCVHTFSINLKRISARAYLVIVAQDASDNTKKMFRNMTDFYQVPMYEYSDKEMLGHFIGKEFRASLAVTNEGLSHSIEERLKQQSQLNNGRN